MSDTHKIQSPAPHKAGDAHAVDFNAYLRKCLYIFVVILVAITLMLWISFLPATYSWGVKAALILAVACVNAFFVAGYLMHLLSERKTVYTVLMFTVFFVIALFGLTLYAMQDFPSGTVVH